MININKIRNLNPWFDTLDFSYAENKYHKRYIYQEIIDALKLRLIISISGLRRVGKTTLLKQLASEVIHKKGQLFYYQFDEKDNNLEETLKYYFEFISKDKAINANNTYIFLDELQYVEKWQDIVKFYYDLNRNIQFLVTGSTSLYLHKETKESLAGRIIDFRIDTLSFDEYLWLSLGKKFNHKFDFSLPGDKIYESMLSRSKNFDLNKEAIYKFLIQGEFPEIVNYSDYDLIKKYLNSSIVDKIISKYIDIFQVTKSEEFFFLYKSILQNTAQVISLNNLSSDLGISRTTVDSYLQVMEKAFLISLLNNYRRSIRAQEKAMDKTFSNSVNLLCAVLGIRDLREIIYPDFAGHIVETYVFNQLKKLGKNVDNIFYFNRDRKEVDFLITSGDRIIPAEVKMKNHIAKTEINRLSDFLDSHKQDYAIIFYSGENNVIKLSGGRKIFCVDWI